MTIVEQYARFVTRLEWQDLPLELRQTTLDLFRDWFANAVAGLESPSGRAFLSLADRYQQANCAMVVGSLEPAEPLAAALVNACAAHSLEFDDSFRAGLYHPGAPIISAAFSAACRAGVSGQTLLASIVAGYEVSLRLAIAVNPAHYRIWHTTGTIGCFGAAAAAAYASGLDPGQTASAFGLAGTQAAGLWEILPDAPQAKNLHPAKAAHAGLLAALLSQQGIKGPPTILEGTRGFFVATVPERVDLKRCVAGLGEEWLTLDTTFKAYPVCGHAMTPIEAAIKLYGDFRAAEIENLEVRAHPVSLQVAGQPLPADEYQAKFSIPYCVAVALLRGRVGLEEFSVRVRESQEVRRLLGLIRLVPDDTLYEGPGRRPARVTVRLADGKVFSALAEIRKGDPERPLSADEKREKFFLLVGPSWGREAAEKAWETTGGLPEASNVQAWAEGLRIFVQKLPH